MGKMTDRINKSDPTRLLEITEQLLAIPCDACFTEKEDVKDARSSLRSYIDSIRVTLAGLGILGGAGGTIYGWKELLAKLLASGLSGLIVITVVGLATIWWLYDVWRNITRRVRELREKLNKLDDCLEKNHCY